MLEGIDGKRLMEMLPQEKRWLDNLKKAFHESDTAVVDGRHADDAFPAICKAIDVAATLRLSWLQPVDEWSPPPKYGNKRKFIDFMHLEIPDANANGVNLPLIDARDDTPVDYNFGGLIYAIRCMVHENENLNVDESPDYHVVLDWNMSRHGYLGTLRDGRFICNANAFWWRTRELLSKFILGAEFFMAFERGDQSCSLSSSPPLQSVHPNDGRHHTGIAK